MRSLLLVAVLVVACQAQDKCNCEWVPSELGKGAYLSMYGLASAKSDVQSIRIFQMQRWVERLRTRLNDAVAAHKGEIAKALENKIERIEGNGCNLREFQCGGSRPRCLSNLLVCDGDAECPNGADESDDICKVIIAPGTTWVGRIHWKACKLRNDQIFRMTIISNRRKSYFKPREWVTASVVTEFQEEGEARSETFTLEGFWVYASRRLVLKPRAGASDKIGAVCHALGDGAHADCHMVQMGASRDMTICASGRVRKQ